MPTRRIFISVAEASADQHAAHLARALKAIDPDIVIEGLGGRRLREAGVTIHHETVDRAAMGWRAALRAAEVWRLLRRTRKHYESNKPDLAICCDSWSMNHHFAQLAKDHGVPVLYYIAPQTWASREGRVKKLADVTDHVACIWPFEEPYFRHHGVKATYVGHPLFDELPADRTSKAALVDPDAPVIGILAGSRKSIAKHNFPRQLEVARVVLDAMPRAKFLVPTTPATHETVSKIAVGFPNLQIHPDAFDKVVPRCDLCLAVSGTATLHTAAYGVPMVVVYRVNPLAWHLVGRWIVKTRTYSMVNYLSGEDKHIVPEHIPWYGGPDAVAAEVLSYLRQPAKRAEQRAALARVVASLDRPGASKNVAELALALIQQD